MIYVELPDDRVRRLSFYLAMEEYVARHMDERDFFFMWQVEPSVIFGRNQLIENEVNLEFCRNRGIRTYRRKSGGGCVYADMKNIMFSYITSEENVGFTFNRYIAEEITQQAHRGVTLLNGMGWYTKEPSQVVMVICRKRETQDVLKIVKNVDPGAFVSVTSATGVYGQGFGMIDGGMLNGMQKQDKK